MPFTCINESRYTLNTLFYQIEITFQMIDIILAIDLIKCRMTIVFFIISKVIPHRLPLEPNIHTTFALQCIFLSANGAVLRQDILFDCFDRFRVDKENEQIQEWLLIHYSSSVGK